MPLRMALTMLSVQVRVNSAAVSPMPTSTVVRSPRTAPSMTRR
jgi:hypothetical protein